MSWLESWLAAFCAVYFLHNLMHPRGEPWKKGEVSCDKKTEREYFWAQNNAGNEEFRFLVCAPPPCCSRKMARGRGRNFAWPVITEKATASREFVCTRGATFSPVSLPSRIYASPSSIKARIEIFTQGPLPQVQCRPVSNVVVADSSTPFSCLPSPS